MRGHDGISSIERKRIRDRRAQQKHRERKDLHTKQLEDQVAFCQRYHEPAHIQSLTEKVAQLEAVNENLLRERDRLLDLAKNFQENLAAFFSSDQCHTPANAGKDASEALVFSTEARPVKGDSLPAFKTISPCHSTSSPAGTDVSAARSSCRIPALLEHPTQTGSHDRHDSAVDFPNTADPATSSSTGAEAFITDGNQALPPQPSNCPPIPVMRDDQALKTSSLGRTQTEAGVGVASVTGIDCVPHTAYSRRQSIATTILIEQAATAPSVLSTTTVSPETIPSPSGPGDETAAPPLPDTSWLLLPENNVPYEPSKLGTCGWLDFPRAVAESPAVPQPEDLLFGSRTNFLANEIHKGVRRARNAETERLAAGWILYMFSRWRVLPSRENFERVPHFLRPTPEQIRQPHTQMIDLVYWPSMRVNIMNQHYSVSQLDEIMELLACCVKLRWPWGKEFLYVGDDGKRHVVDEFLKMLMSLDGWGVTREFRMAYPDLLKGMNVHIIEL